MPSRHRVYFRHFQLETGHVFTGIVQVTSLFVVAMLELRQGVFIKLSMAVCSFQLDHSYLQAEDMLAFTLQFTQGVVTPGVQGRVVGVQHTDRMRMPGVHRIQLLTGLLQLQCQRLVLLLLGVLLLQLRLGQLSSQLRHLFVRYGVQLLPFGHSDIARSNL